MYRERTIYVSKLHTVKTPFISNKLSSSLLQDGILFMEKIQILPITLSKNQLTRYVKKLYQHCVAQFVEKSNFYDS